MGCPAASQMASAIQTGRTGADRSSSKEQNESQYSPFLFPPSLLLLARSFTFVTDFESRQDVKHLNLPCHNDRRLLEQDAGSMRWSQDPAVRVLRHLDFDILGRGRASSGLDDGAAAAVQVGVAVLVGFLGGSRRRARWPLGDAEVGRWRPVPELRLAWAKRARCGWSSGDGSGMGERADEAEIGGRRGVQRRRRQWAVGAGRPRAVEQGATACKSPGTKSRWCAPEDRGEHGLYARMCDGG